MPLWFIAVATLTAVAAGTTASVVGFGIGSLLTPLIAWRFGTDFAVAAVALPHLIGSALRGWRLRAHIDRAVLLRFGLLSAAGGLTGALVFSQLAPHVLSRVLGFLLLLTAIAGLTGWSSRWKPRGAMVWLLGALSGFFGGVAGNQGGLRAGALSRFDLPPIVFVATSTVTGVLIDLVRTPIYIARVGDDLLASWYLIAAMIAGVLAGTVAGERLLFGLTHEAFRRVVAIAVGLLGIWFLLRAG